MSILPLLYYPTSITLVDDDPLLLQALTELLKDDYPLIKFNDSKEAVNYFESYIKLRPALKLLRGCTESENYDVLGHLPVDLDLGALKEVRNYQERAPEVSVVIVDYNMPEINGIELCRQLKSLPAKKILLTGNASEQLATAAFNEGIIDCFIRKDSQSLSNEIQQYLKILTQEYLANNTKQLLNHLETDNLLAVSDPKFIEFFKEWCRVHHIREYFIIDKNANFLLIDNNKNKYIFIIHTEHTLNNFTDLHEDILENSQLVRAVRLREKIPFFGENKESWELSHTEWPSCFHTPQIFQGRQKYYYSIIK